jgi:hypothetical protein
MIRLKYKPVKELFKFNEPPYIAIGASKGGKTTLCLDIIAQHAHEATNIYYFTQTEQKLGSQGGGIGMIPEAYRREPTYENFYAVYNELREINELIDSKTESFVQLLIEITRNEALVTKIMKIINDDTEALAQERLEYYRNVRKYDIEKANEYAKCDSEGFKYETLSRVILDYAKQNESIIHSLSQESISRLQTLHSRRPKTILVMDDVTAALNEMQRDKTKVMWKGQSVYKYNAFSNILMDLLVRGRHFNAIICIFVHGMNVLEEAKKNLVNLLVVEPSVISQMLNVRTISKQAVQALATAGQIVFSNEYKYHVIHVNCSEVSDIIDVSVTKADLHGALEKLQLDPLNIKFIDMYDQIKNGLVTTQSIYNNAKNETDSDDVIESSDEPGSDESDDDDSGVAGDDIIQSIV